MRPELSVWRSDDGWVQAELWFSRHHGVVCGVRWFQCYWAGVWGSRIFNGSLG